MGVVVEDKAEFYSARIPRKQRKVRRRQCSPGRMIRAHRVLQSSQPLSQKQRPMWRRRPRGDASSSKSRLEAHAEAKATRKCATTRESAPHLALSPLTVLLTLLLVPVDLHQCARNADDSSVPWQLDCEQPLGIVASVDDASLIMRLALCMTRCCYGRRRRRRLCRAIQPTVTKHQNSSRERRQSIVDPAVSRPRSCHEFPWQ
jgi:hypothetical protein